MAGKSRERSRYTQEVIDGIKKAAEVLDCEPWEVGKRDLLRHSLVTNYKLGQTPGLGTIKNTYFPKPVELGEKHRAKYAKKHVADLEKRVGELEWKDELLTNLVTRNLKPLPVIKAPKLLMKKSKGRLRRHLVGMLNDMHYGLEVSREEVAGLNQYGWTEAARRTAHLIKQICQYKLDKRGEIEKMHLILNGDLLAGIIHGLNSRDLNLLTNQVNGAIHILVHAVAALLHSFKNVEVHFTVGNHGDMVHRREGGRITSQVYDNYESVVFYAVSAAFSKNPRVKFITNKTLFGSIQLPSGRLIYTHGHTLFSKELGNPGTQIKAKQLADAIMRFNAGEVEKGEKRGDLFLFGHTHVNFSLTTPDGVRVFNAASLSGIDSYAFSLGINHNITEQLLFESTDKHIFGDNRLIDVGEADNDTSLDSIIPPYTGELVWKGTCDVA